MYFNEPGLTEPTPIQAQAIPCAARPGHSRDRTDGNRQDKVSRPRRSGPDARHLLRPCIAPMLGMDRQTMMFSATMPKAMAELFGHYLDKPIRAEASPPGKVADKVSTVCISSRRTRSRIS